MKIENKAEKAGRSPGGSGGQEGVGSGCLDGGKG